MEVSWIKYYNDKEIQIFDIQSDVLYEYGEYFTGLDVCTVVTIADTGKAVLKAKTDNNDSYFFSYVMNFDDDSESELYQKGDLITIVGTVDDASVWGSTVTLNGCHIISSGDIAKAKESVLIENKDIQIAYAQEIKQNAENAVAEQSAMTKTDYIQNCIELNYSDIERTPNDFNGKYAKITGVVIQVSEGWFGSVTLRVNSTGNVWYVTYVRKDDNESRILEDDSVTVYGKCTGVETYSSVLGNSVTIPSVSAEYIDIK